MKLALCYAWSLPSGYRIFLSLLAETVYTGHCPTSIALAPALRISCVRIPNYFLRSIFDLFYVRANSSVYLYENTYLPPKCWVWPCLSLAIAKETTFAQRPFQCICAIYLPSFTPSLKHKKRMT